MPKVRRSKRKQEGMEGTAEWWDAIEILFDCGLVFDGDAEVLGLPADRHETRAEQRELWQRFGRGYLDSGRPARHCLKLFGEPKGGDE